MNVRVILLVFLLSPLVAWSLSEVDEASLSDVSTPSTLAIRRAPVGEASAESAGDDNTAGFSVPGIRTVTRDNEEPVNEKDVKGVSAISALDKTSDSSGSVKIPDNRPYSILYPEGMKAESSDPYVFTIKSGDMKMKDTIIQNRGSVVMPGSWVDIKPR
jgi:hypothetical protein